MHKQPIQGIHHITAMASDPQKNVDFYTQVLGQRLVKTTVNFDDPGTYHLYYGDNIGSPGTIMTFFPWPHARRGRRGAGEVAASAYAILPSSLGFWRARLAEFEITFSEEVRFGETVLVFPDPDGMMIELVAREGDPAPTVWPNSPIAAEHALRAFQGVTLWVNRAEGTAAVLTDIFGYKKVGEEGARHRYQGAGNIAQFVDLLVRPELGRGGMGAGSVHHVAFRTVDDGEQVLYQHEIAQNGHGVTEVKDRQYFHSIYFREPSGVLFEVATDAPGFAYDEPVEELGSHLKLPLWLEPHRAKIEGLLPALQIAEYA
ncbi:MAG: ring-cleaving dioxygenase [Anaerolineales bacterium]|nr:ring-cleaving dioxygenase [Anaerolineales bacterium]